MLETNVLSPTSSNIVTGQRSERKGESSPGQDRSRTNTRGSSGPGDVGATHKVEQGGTRRHRNS